MVRWIPNACQRGTWRAKGLRHAANKLYFAVVNERDPQRPDGPYLLTLSANSNCHSIHSDSPGESSSPLRSDASLISATISAETSRDQPCEVLKATILTGLLYWPSTKRR